MARHGSMSNVRNQQDARASQIQKWWPERHRERLKGFRDGMRSLFGGEHSSMDATAISNLVFANLSEAGNYGADPLFQWPGTDLCLMCAPARRTGITDSKMIARTPRSQWTQLRTWIPLQFLAPLETKQFHHGPRQTFQHGTMENSSNTIAQLFGVRLGK